MSKIHGVGRGAMTIDTPGYRLQSWGIQRNIYNYALILIRLCIILLSICKVAVF